MEVRDDNSAWCVDESGLVPVALNRVIIADLPTGQTNRIALEIELEPYFQHLFKQEIGHATIYVDGNSTQQAYCVFPSYYHGHHDIPPTIEPGAYLGRWKVRAITKVERWSIDDLQGAVQVFADRVKRRYNGLIQFPPGTDI